MPSHGATASKISSTVKGVGTGGAILGGLDIAEGGGLDRARGAYNEAVDGLAVAAEQAGGVLNSIFGCLPWQSSCDPSQIAPVFGGNATNVSNATGTIVPNIIDLFAILV